MDCQENKCKRRDNKFGVTWCVKCGKLFHKPSGVQLIETDKIIYRNIK
jgi:ribosomal protein L37AE/L43A